MADEKQKTIEGKIPSFQRTMSVIVGNSRSSRNLVAQPAVEPKSSEDFYDYSLYLQSIKQKITDTEKSLQTFSENERKTMENWNAWTASQYNPAETYKSEEILYEEEEEDTNKMVELDVSSWEHYKEQMNMLQEQLDTVPQVEEPLINRRLSRLPAWIPKAPDTAPIEADPFQLRSEPVDNSILAMSSSTDLLDVDLENVSLPPPPLYLASFDPMNILKYLCFKDILHLSAACKPYYKMISSNVTCWKRLYFYCEKKFITEEDINIWSSDTEKLKFSPVVALNELVKKLTSSEVKVPDEQLLLAWSEMRKPWSSLVRKLIQRFMIPPPSSFTISNEEWKQNIYNRVCPSVCFVLLKIIPMIQPLTDELAELIRVFVKGFVMKPYPRYGRMMLKSVKEIVVDLKVKADLLKFPLLSLNENVSLCVFSYFTFEELCVASQVCKQFHQLSCNVSLWKDLYVYHESMLPSTNRFLCRLILKGMPDDVNIWKDSEIGIKYRQIEDKQQVSHASLNKLVFCFEGVFVYNIKVELLTPQGSLPDVNDIKAFMATYQTFTTPQQLVRKLIQRFEVPPPATSDVQDWNREFKKPIQLRVSKILKIFIEEHPNLDVNTRILLKIFLRRILYEEPILAKPVIKALASKNESKSRISTSQEGGITKTSSIIGLNILRRQVQKSVENISDVDQLADLLTAEEVAKQLTLIEFELYSELKPAEFFKQSWAKPKTHHKSPNIRSMIDRFNLLTNWISTCIIDPKKLKIRTKRMIFFIQVAKSLRSLHNFHTLMAFISAMNETAVHRLKFTKEKVPVKVQVILKELEALMSADGSYKDYRNELAASPAPCLPYLGVYLRDLTYFDDDSSSDSTLINFKQRKNIYSVIYLIQSYQQQPYSFKKVPNVYNYLKQLDGVKTAEELFKVSLAREPRNCTISDLE